MGSATSARRKAGPGRPPLPEGQRAVRLNITLEPSELDALDDLAAEDGVPRSHEIAKLVAAERRRRAR